MKSIRNIKLSKSATIEEALKVIGNGAMKNYNEDELL